MVRIINSIAESVVYFGRFFFAVVDNIIDYQQSWTANRTRLKS